MSWIVEYLRYHSPGRYEAETLTEAIDVAMSYVEEGWAAPTAILGPDGSAVVDKSALSNMYAADWGRISTDAVAQALNDPETTDDDVALAYVLIYANTDTDAYRVARDAANRLGEALG